eukprot:TRINITY_DN3328_c0_g1_i1.p1 TRINITY_DN3328_c0_g1~~TRINITY_DN3328_c0_g1_i1.p1  ORF type:complete len:179 (+),score=34.97 TRINITY_DN3328_c0_g1_i1:73-609(+)
MSSPQHYYVSYNQIHTLIANTAPKIKSSSNPPEIMVAIAGGGLIPARILRTFLKIPILAVGIQLYSESHEMGDKPHKIQWLDDQNAETLAQKRVLVVDEVDDTRTTLKFCLDELVKLGVKMENLSVFVLHNKKKPKKTELDPAVKYYVGEETSDKWIMFPWEAEDIEAHTGMCKKLNE